MPGWIKTGIRLCGGKSDPRLCCKHPGEFVIFFSFIVLKETINNRT